MILNDILTRQNIITKLALANDGRELPKQLKVKIMRMRMTYSKIKKQFDEETEEFVKQLVTDEYKELANKVDKTEEESKKLEELNSKINSDYKEYLNQKGLETVEGEDFTFSEEEYADILDINSSGEFQINGGTVKAADLMEAVYELFVK